MRFRTFLQCWHHEKEVRSWNIRNSFIKWLYGWVLPKRKTWGTRHFYSFPLQWIISIIYAESCVSWKLIKKQNVIIYVITNLIWLNRYNEGNAIILESDVRCLSDDNMLLTCLQTKWPNIDVQWIGGGTPSINWHSPPHCLYFKPVIIIGISIIINLAFKQLNIQTIYKSTCTIVTK